MEKKVVTRIYTPKEEAKIRFGNSGLLEIKKLSEERKKEGIKGLSPELQEEFRKTFSTPQGVVAARDPKFKERRESIARVSTGDYVSTEHITGVKNLNERVLDLEPGEEKVELAEPKGRIIDTPKKEESYILNHTSPSLYERITNWFNKKEVLPPVELDRENYTKRFVIHKGTDKQRSVEVFDKLRYLSDLQRAKTIAIKPKRSWVGVGVAASIVGLFMGAYALYNHFSDKIDSFFENKQIVLTVQDKQPTLEDKVQEYQQTIVQNQSIETRVAEAPKVQEIKSEAPKQVDQKIGIYSVDYSKTRFDGKRIVGSESKKIIKYSKHNGTLYKGEGDELKLYASRGSRSYEIKDGTKKADGYMVICYAKDGTFMQTLEGKFKGGKAKIQLPKGVGATDTMLVQGGYSIASKINVR